jgi:hypothetical protein
MPDGYSIRRYHPNGKPYQWPEPGGWVLARPDWNSDYDYTYLMSFTPSKRQHVKFCPWCGHDLGDA